MSKFPMNFFECRETKLDDKREMKCSETASLLVKKSLNLEDLFYFFIRVKSKLKKKSRNRGKIERCGVVTGNGERKE